MSVVVEVVQMDEVDALDAKKSFDLVVAAVVVALPI